MTAHNIPRLILIVFLLLTVTSPVLGQDAPARAFAAIRDHRLVIVTDHGEEIAVETPPAGSVFSPSGSPDGRLLAFVLASEGYQFSLWVTDAGGSAPVQLVPAGVQSTFAPAFTPSGDILYVAEAPRDDPSLGYRITLNLISPDDGAAPTVLGTLPFFAEGGGGSPLPADWQVDGETDAFATGTSILHWTDYGILHSLSFTGEGLALFDPQSGQDRILVPVGDSATEPERHINQAKLSPDGQTVAGVLDVYDETTIMSSLALVDLATGTLIEVSTAEPPRYLAWAADGTLFYSARVPLADLLESRPDDEQRAFSAATGGSNMHVGAWEAHLRHLDPATGADNLLYSAAAYEAVRLQVAADNHLWFSQVANMDAWVDAVAGGALAPDQATRAEQLALVPLTLYRLDPATPDAPQRIGEGLHAFTVRPPDGADE